MRCVELEKGSIIALTSAFSLSDSDPLTTLSLSRIFVVGALSAMSPLRWGKTGGMC